MKGAAQTLALIIGLGWPGVLVAEWRVEELGIPINAVNYENTGGALASGPGGEGTMFYTCVKSDSNPREIGPVGKGQYRTRTNYLGPDGKIYVGSIPSYRSAETGAFTICDPVTGKMEVRTDFVKGGVVEALAADDRYVYGAGGGEFFVFDPARNEKRFRVQRPVVSPAAVNGGKVVGSGKGKLFVYDREANAIVKDEANATGDFTHIATGRDGSAYGVNTDHVVRVSPEGRAEVLVAQGGRFAAVDGQGRVYFARGPKLCRCVGP